MAIPTSKPLSLSTVQTEYGGSNPIGMSEYRGDGNAPASGPIDLWGDFNGTSNVVTVSGFVYHDTWRNDSLTGTSVNLSSKLNNQSTATYEERTGSYLSYGDLCFGSNQSYATGIGSILAVRKCVVYGSGDVLAGNEYSYQSRALLIDPTGDDAAYGTSGQQVGSFSSSKNLVSIWGATEAGNWLKDGMYAELGWTIGDVPYVGRTGSRFHYFYVDVDFDYSPA